MLVYEDYHFGEPQEMALYHIEGFSHFAHLHRSYELLYVVKGNLTAFVDNRHFPMNPGDFILFCLMKSIPTETKTMQNVISASFLRIISRNFINAQQNRH